MVRGAFDQRDDVCAHPVTAYSIDKADSTTKSMKPRFSLLGKQFVLFDLEFVSMEEFEQWLEVITFKYMTGYTKNRTNVLQSGVKTQMYLCR